MSARDALNGIQFQHTTDDEKNWHQLIARSGEGKYMGSMSWKGKTDDSNTGAIGMINVHGSYRRQGVATAMWAQGQTLANRDETISRPVHSDVLLDAGRSWITGMTASRNRPGRDQPKKVSRDDPNQTQLF
jgi:hypothetical protein